MALAPSVRKRPQTALRLEVLEDRTVAVLSVLSASPAPGAVLLPMTFVDLNFNQPVNPATVQTTDLSLSRGTVTSAEVLAGSNNQTVRFGLSGLTTTGPLGVGLAPNSVEA